MKTILERNIFRLFLLLWFVTCPLFCNTTTLNQQNLEQPLLTNQKVVSESNQFALPFTPSSSLPAEPSKPTKYVLDRTLAVIYHPEDIVVISASDLRPSLDGAPKTFKQVLLEKLMVLDARELKITVTEEDVDKQLATVQKENNLTRDDVIAIFKQAGLSVTQAREDLRDQQMIQTVIEARTRSKTAVSAKEIETYYAENPIVQPGNITFCFAFVPFEHYKSKVTQRTAIQKGIESGDINTTAAWMDPITLNLKDVPEDKVFLKDLSSGSIVQAQETEEGVQLLKLIDKVPETVVPLKEREREIMMQFRMDRRGKAIAEYHEELLKKARIKYLDQEYAPKEAIVELPSAQIPPATIA